MHVDLVKLKGVSDCFELKPADAVPDTVSPAKQPAPVPPMQYCVDGEALKLLQFGGTAVVLRQTRLMFVGFVPDRS